MEYNFENAEIIKDDKNETLGLIKIYPQQKLCIYQELNNEIDLKQRRFVLEEAKKVMETYDVDYIYSDMSKVTIKEELFNIENNEYARKYHNDMGLKKYAIYTDKNEYLDFSMKYLISFRSKSRNYLVKIFDSTEGAFEWLEI